VGHREVLYGCGKSRLPRDSIPRPRRHTDRPIPVHTKFPKYLELSRKWLLYVQLPVTFTNSILPTQCLHVFPITATINININ